MKTTEEAPFVDLLSLEFLAEPWAVIERAKKESGLVRTGIGVMAIRRELIGSLLSDSRLRSSVVDSILNQELWAEGVAVDFRSNSLLAIEGEVHQRLRGKFSRVFTPLAVEEYRAGIEEIFRSVSSPILIRGHCEFMEDIANPFVVRVLCHLLGVSDDHCEEFSGWNQALTWLVSLNLKPHRKEVELALTELKSFTEQLIHERRLDAREDFLSALIRDGQEDGGPTDLQLQALIGSLFMGFDKARKQLGLTIGTFAQHPEQWDMLADQPEIIPQAIEEVLRFEGSVRSVPRIVIEEVEVDGYRLEPGTLMQLPIAIAHRDSTAYDKPEIFDITAIREPQLQFGSGTHYCLGANLAKAMLHEALTTLPSRMPNLALDSEPTWRSPLGIYGPETLPLRFGS